MRSACVLAGLLACSLACQLAPEAEVTRKPKSPGDNHYKILISGDVERYVPDERYVVTVVGSRTHDRLQQFTRFKLIVDPLDPSQERGPHRQGQFQLFADTLSRFHDACVNTVLEADDLPKTEVQVMWKAPPAGSGCVNIKAMVFENASSWFAEDGQLTRRLCEEVARESDCCACDDAKYRMVFEGLWSPQTHPKDFPKALWLTHFSDVIGATHGSKFSFWGEGQIATDGFRSLAEWGSVQLMERELQQNGKKLRSIVKAAGLWHPNVNTNTTASFVVDRKRHLLSVASMFGPSPDWVVGVSGLELCRKDCTWEESRVIDLLPYDAGTDNGITYMSPNAETTPRERIYRITPMYPEDPRAPFYSPGAASVPPLARLYLTRESLVHRSCDEEVLQQLVAEVAESHENDKAECATGAWSAWSACSVSCGKGLRMRTRTYREPAAAARAACASQLVAKEMCVAEIAECEDAPPELDSNLAPAEDVPAEICETSEWGPWSECSVSCGVGVNTRRRRFLSPMGNKKCPLVDIVEDRKCMMAGCTEPEPEPEPGCPTTPWSRWSPCSATCGRGLRLRTRLLLVPPQQQESCSERVELLQQQPCVERESCETDMMTIKQMCMQEADPGPCRGHVRRWAFSAQKGMCLMFYYKGCLGNSNNFLSSEQCMEACKPLMGALSGGSPSVQDNSVVPATSQTSDTDAQAPVSLDCRLSEWSDWSPCSVRCGTGFQERTRTVLVPARSGGSCSSKLSRRRRCRKVC